MDGDTKTMTFLQEVVDILLAYIVESFDRETKVIDFHYPNELLQLNNWELQDGPATLDDILISCRATLKYAIKTGRPVWEPCKLPNSHHDSEKIARKQIQVSGGGKHSGLIYVRNINITLKKNKKKTTKTISPSLEKNITIII